MKIQILFFPLVLLLLTINTKAQGDLHKIDSLENLLKSKNLTDSVKLRVVYDLALQYLYSNNEKTLSFADQSIQLAEKTKKKKLKSEALSLQGVVYKNKGDYKTAVEKHILALKIKEEINDTLGRAIAYNDIGILYKQMKNFIKALECYRLSNLLLTQVGNKIGISYTLGNIGTIHSEMKNFDSALFYYNKALTIAEKMKNKGALTTAYSNIGEIYGKKGNAKKALEYFKKSLVIDIENHDDYGMILSYTNVGNALKDLGKYNDALESFSKAEKLCTDNDAKPLLKDLYFAMAESYKESKDPWNAYNYLSKYTLLNDSILNTETTQQIAEMETKYQTEKKDKELILKDAEITLQQADASQKAIQRNAFVIGFLLVLCLAFFILLGYKQKQKANIIITKQKNEVEHQKELVEEKQKEILDSILYAKRLQEAILPPVELIRTHLPESFVMYKPKDIVAGDFYWMENIDNRLFIAAADSTGHGVPGAMVSVVCCNALNRAVKEFGLRNSGEILDKVTDLILETFEKSSFDVKDGMDISLLSINKNNKQIHWSGANNPLWYTKDGTMIEIKANKQPIGKSDIRKPFTTNTIEYSEGLTFYLFTDGLPDQFGGQSGKKYMYKRFKQNLSSIYKLPMNEQQLFLETEFQNWKGDVEQVDDVTVIGIKI